MSNLNKPTIVSTGYCVQYMTKLAGTGLGTLAARKNALCPPYGVNERIGFVILFQVTNRCTVRKYADHDCYRQNLPVSPTKILPTGGMGLEIDTVSLGLINLEETKLDP